MIDFNIENVTYNDVQLKRAYNGVYNHYIKRFLDLICSAVSLVVLSPFLAIISAVVATESGFHILYCPERGGYRGKPFRIIKFRTMVKDADKIGGGTTALNDERITKVGKFLRKTKLDELPQVINVLFGSMSFVGPRPELLQYTEQYQNEDKHILDVRPGITDFASLAFINLDQIVGQINADMMYEKYVLKQKNQLRLKYVAELSFATDLRLITKTIYRVIRKAFLYIRNKFLVSHAYTNGHSSDKRKDATRWNT